MKSLLDAYETRDIIAFEKIIKENELSIMGDSFIKDFIEPMIHQLRTLFILDATIPYSSVDVSFLASSANINKERIEELIIELLLDKKLHGRYDQMKGVLYLKEKNNVNEEFWQSMNEWSTSLNRLEQIMIKLDRKEYISLPYEPKNERKVRSAAWESFHLVCDTNQDSVGYALCQHCKERDGLISVKHKSTSGLLKHINICKKRKLSEASFPEPGQMPITSFLKVKNALIELGIVFQQLYNNPCDPFSFEYHVLKTSSMLPLDQNFTQRSVATDATLNDSEHSLNSFVDLQETLCQIFIAGISLDRFVFGIFEIIQYPLERGYTWR
ncbi:hypothetical protein O9G_002223 [Rozella allomycis CSF55]|uniref:PCI domain-containing protein n=1 Tax=Rozella allomycis (strain CSF55) TaxID=988480 RepID=A0A075AQ95_ROZAC|nr:hypothetical protein O9G_002223 [Rozella allomycis CSF55]|eukprot:EPZ32383.1 hypothetical protein O9G_002223 [Rozella allomycis CSF55]